MIGIGPSARAGALVLRLDIHRGGIAIALDGLADTAVLGYLDSLAIDGHAGLGRIIAGRDGFQGFYAGRRGIGVGGGGVYRSDDLDTRVRASRGVSELTANKKGSYRHQNNQANDNNRLRIR
jgi:hypothetical protein